MFKNFRLTVSRKIYVIIAFSFACFTLVTLYQLREMSDELKHQKQI